jgi:hypothetical protein
MTFLFLLRFRMLGMARREHHRKCIDTGTARRAPTAQNLRFVGAQRAVPSLNQI